MAFGVTRSELEAFKQKASEGGIAILTHYWMDERFPNSETVTKVASSNLENLLEWGAKYDLPKSYIDFGHTGLPHYDLFGELQLRILKKEGKHEQIERFHLEGEDND
ncbi:hypothetical protein [Listeria sp. PSOL-1]|uniref:hypothetical protein n=1 Tax=Listeria sp. PSOL-1 TaxID=1844999 RepID=UPI0013D8AE23|nr:hypothetical protein [Listeria sp. PSOL-1]